MKVLCTFSGKRGDILWSLPSVRNIHVQGHEVDFAIMPQYRDMLPLLEAQTYINKAFAIEEWQCTGSPHGDQPWQSPNFEGREKYGKVYDLTYKQHPFGVCLMTWIAKESGAFPIWAIGPLPFIKSGETEHSDKLIAYAFNEMHKDEKQRFLQDLKNLLPQFAFMDVSNLPWTITAKIIDGAFCFVGCRSSNYVLAHGLGKKVICFEPSMARNHVGPFKDVFGCPYGTEQSFYKNEEVQSAADSILQWKEQEDGVIASNTR